MKATYKVVGRDGCFYVRLCRPEQMVTAANRPARDCSDCISRMNGQCRFEGVFLVKQYSCQQAALDAAKALIKGLKLKESVCDGKGCKVVQLQRCSET